MEPLTTEASTGVGIRPAVPMNDDAVAVAARDLLRLRLEESIASKQRLLASPCMVIASHVAAAVVRSLEAGGKVFFFGNGGSAMDAGHLAAELLGRYYIDRPALPALSLSDFTATSTAIANDYSYDEIFVRPLRGLARAGDVAIGLTTSGNSANVVAALKAANELGLVSVALTGAGGGEVAAVAQYCVAVPERDTPRVQEACLQVGHSICEVVERHFFGGRSA